MTEQEILSNAYSDLKEKYHEKVILLQAARNVIKELKQKDPKERKEIVAEYRKDDYVREILLQLNAHARKATKHNEEVNYWKDKYYELIRNKNL